MKAVVCLVHLLAWQIVVGQSISTNTHVALPLEKAVSDTTRLPDPLLSTRIADTLRISSTDQLKRSTEQLHAASKKVRARTKGHLEAGGVYGAIPFTLPGSGPYNGFTKGEVSFTGLGMPFGIVFDLGTDQPVRGQRNSLRLVFDPPALLNQERWQHAHALHAQQRQLDSLEALQAVERRRVAGLLARLNASPIPAPPATDTVHAGAAQLVDSLPSVPEQPVGNTMDAALIEPPTTLPYSSTQDSLHARLEQATDRAAQLDSLVQRQKDLVQREKALVNAAADPNGVIGHLSKGLKRFELGSCAPNTSEFLINGVNFQGISFEYAHKDFFFSFDRGRSFDDTWRNTDPVANDLSRLQQSLFLRDVQDLAPKKLTAVRLGFGSAEGTHVHVGYLHGRRPDLPIGMTGTTNAIADLINHVLELDGGHAFTKQHTLRLVYARSLVTSTLPVQGEDEDARPDLGDLLNAPRPGAEALKVRWTSELNRIGTRIELEARRTGDHFQSFGLGFVRNGSRAGEIRWDQRFGKRVRLRSRGVLEERTLPSSDRPGTMSIRRASSMLLLTPTRSISLRFGASPTYITAHPGSVTSGNTFNNTWSTGGTWRKRWRKTTVSADLDASLFTWAVPERSAQQALNHTATIAIEHAQRWSLGATWANMRHLGSDSAATTMNTSIRGAYRTNKGLQAEGTLQIPSGARCGWNAAVRRTLNEHWSIKLESSRWARLDTYLSTIDGFHLNDAYTWTLSFIYLW